MTNIVSASAPGSAAAQTPARLETSAGVAEKDAHDAGPPLRIGTRKSALAVRQTEQIISQLQARHPGLRCEVVAVSVLGDRDKSTPLPALGGSLGGKGLWTNELEAKLLAGDLDMVVHSLKDMPTTLPPGCVLAAVPEREDPRDVLVLPLHKQQQAQRQQQQSQILADLPDGSVVGTSSVRRAAQLRRRFPHLRFLDVRGNIDTRLRKCDEATGPFSAIVLAAAGLNRMGQQERISQFLDADTGGILHAVGQGALGVEARADDARTQRLLELLIHPDTLHATAAERSLMRTLEGGCSVPIGVHSCWLDAKLLRLRATVVSVDGSEAVDVDTTAQVTTVEEAELFGQKVAAELVKQGAGKILDAINATRASTVPTIAT